MITNYSLLAFVVYLRLTEGNKIVQATNSFFN